jgi:hypothetical protein
MHSEILARETAPSTALSPVKASTPTTSRPLRRADHLGLFSLGLGLAEVLAPDALGALSGVGTGPGRRALTRACGVREIAAGVLILTAKKPKKGVWARVFGDVLDLALLGAAFFVKGSDPARLAGSIGAVASVTAADIATARALSRPQADQVRRVVKVITVQSEPALVRTLWERMGETRDALSVTFLPGPDGATVIEATLTGVGTGGSVGGLVARVAGLPRPMQLDRLLRQFKQVVETGEVLHSDASIHTGMHPAQPAADDDDDVEVLS